MKEARAKIGAWGLNGLKDGPSLIRGRGRRWGRLLPRATVARATHPLLRGCVDILQSMMHFTVRDASDSTEGTRVCGLHVRRRRLPWPCSAEHFFPLQDADIVARGAENVPRHARVVHVTFNR